MDKFSFLKPALDARAQQGRLRNLQPLLPLPQSRVLWQGRSLVNLSSNDFLGLSEHPLLATRAQEYLTRFGAGSRASRLVTGELPAFAELESRLATFKGKPAAAIFNSGFQANVTLPLLFAGANDLILMDKLIHHSLIQGALLAKAQVQRFRHNDLNHLEQLLSQANQKSYQRILLCTESVFSMDGDLADLPALQALADRYNAILLVDEAHATGVMGEQGQGLAQGADLVMGTFGKALGCFGAYLACPQLVKQHLINFGGGFIYSTALPPQVLGAIDAALELVPHLHAERAHLQAISAQLRQGAQGLGWDVGASQSQIIPLMAGSEDRALALMEHLREQGFWVSAIRPPTVEAGKSRLRVALNALITAEVVRDFLQALQGFRG